MIATSGARGSSAVPRELFREAMASFPSGVTIVTTADDTGRWWGFTASSFCSVSMDPPLVLVCLAKKAECHPVFGAARNWVVQVIHNDHVELAMRFATRGADKFAGADFTGSDLGPPVLAGAAVTMHCTTFARHEGGDHTILVGNVGQIAVDDAQLPAVYFRRGFHPLTMAN